MAIKIEGDPLGRDQAPAKPEKPVKPKKDDQKKRTPAASTEEKVTRALAKAGIPAPEASSGAIARGEPVVRLIFPCPVAMAERIEDQRHKRRIKTTSATIRALLEEALK